MPASPLTVDVGALTDYLTAPYAETVERVWDDLIEHAGEFGRRADETIDAYRDRILAVLLALSGTDRSGLGFPAEHGGSGSPGESVAAFQTLAYGDLSLLVMLGVQFGLFGGAILNLGTEPHHEAYLRDVITGRMLGCFAMTETAHGSNVAHLETTATYDRDASEFVVNSPTPGSYKDYIGNAARHGRWAVVFAQLVVGGVRRGVHALLVRIREDDGTPRPGVDISDCGPKLGLDGVDNGRIRFDQVRVPREALLNRYGDVAPDGTYTSVIDNADRRFFTMLGTLVRGRISVGGAAVSTSKLALTIAIRYANRRHQFGRTDGSPEVPILTYRQHQRRLIPLLARTIALSAAQQALTGAMNESFRDPGAVVDRRVLESRAAGHKALATWHASDTIQTCREACGGAGYLTANMLGALRADTDVFTTFEGDNTVLLQLVAKDVLSEFRDGFNALNPVGTVRIIAEQTVDAFVERTSLRPVVERLRDAVPSRGDDAGLGDRRYHAEMLRTREEHLRTGLAMRLRRGVDRGEDAFEVFIRCEDHVVSLALAASERRLFDAFAASIEKARAEVRPVLDALCALYALSVIERERGWYLEHRRLSAARSKAITARVGALCEQLAPIAESVTDAFAIPDALLRAPIAQR
jgi:acyl-CoA oxidase